MPYPLKFKNLHGEVTFITFRLPSPVIQFYYVQQWLRPTPGLSVTLITFFGTETGETLTAPIQKPLWLHQSASRVPRLAPTTKHHTPRPAWDASTASKARGKARRRGGGTTARVRSEPSWLDHFLTKGWGRWSVNLAACKNQREHMKDAGHKKTPPEDRAAVECVDHPCVAKLRHGA